MRRNKGYSVEEAYESFNNHPVRERVDDIRDIFPHFDYPNISPIGEMARIWYRSHKIIESGDSGKYNNYTHCIVAEPQSRDACVCGFTLHDHENPSKLATVYASDPHGKKVSWPKGAALLGDQVKFDMLDRNGDYLCVRFNGKAMAFCHPDMKKYFIIADGGRDVYFVRGGEMIVTPDGIAG